ncbi:tetratricopeptide repeat protein [Caballeronia mineralivorans]|uniref:tetratricopeptide repeat protein n=1 Tax=Caballeronia mineralivorans TaxID=2010198 RepID=UPI003A598CAD
MQSALEAYQRGGLMEAERAYHRLLERDDRNGLAHNNLANLLRKSGRFSEAEAHYDRALAWLPDSAEIRDNRGDARTTSAVRASRDRVSPRP